MNSSERGRAYENRLAKERGLEKQPYSGAGAHKEDLRGEHELIQCKSTANATTYTLLKKDMQDLSRNAMHHGRVGVLYLEWGASEFVIMRRKDYENHVVYQHHCEDCGEVITPLCDKCKDQQ